MIDSYSVTILLAEFLILWWVFQVISFQFWLDPGTYKWLFTFEQLSQATPGWLFSGISHNLNPTTHLFPNVALLLVFGALSEPHLKTRDYLWFFFVVGFVASPIYLFLNPSGGNVAGASAPIFGFAMFGTVHYVRSHSDRLSFDSESLPRFVFSVLVVVVPITATAIVSLQLLGVRPRGTSAVESHAVGLLAGILLVYLQPAISRLPCRDDRWTQSPQ